ncbi:MAG: hypothetical protein ACOYU0_01055 [Nitrospirota bacterium]
MKKLSAYISLIAILAILSGCVPPLHQAVVENDRSWLDEVKAGVILGREEFIESIKKLLGEKDKDDETPSLKRLIRADISVEKILKVITE